MAVEPFKETIKEMRLDGHEQDVQVYKYISARKKQQLINKLFEGVDIKTQGALPPNKAMQAIGELAEMIWADQNLSIDDVEGSTLHNYVMERFNSFLGNFGFRAKAGDSESGEQRQDESSDNSAGSGTEKPAGDGS